MKTLHLLIISIVTLPCGERHALAEPEYVDCSTTIQRLTKAHQAVAPAIREYEVAKKERDPRRQSTNISRGTTPGISSHNDWLLNKPPNTTMKQKRPSHARSRSSTRRWGRSQRNVCLK